jgi:hypothetical protein
VNNQIVWVDPFSEYYQEGMVYCKFECCGQFYAVGFEHIKTLAEFEAKGIKLGDAFPQFRFPYNTGVWAVVFDAIDPVDEQPQGYRHVQLNGLASGKVLLGVASIIYDHYTVCNAGAYVFSAAGDPLHERKTDLSEIYSKALGLQGHPKPRMFDRLTGWNAYTDLNAGGRSYVVTTQSYQP